MTDKQLTYQPTKAPDQLEVVTAAIRGLKTVSQQQWQQQQQGRTWGNGPYMAANDSSYNKKQLNGLREQPQQEQERQWKQRGCKKVVEGQKAVRSHRGETVSPGH